MSADASHATAAFSVMDHLPVLLVAIPMIGASVVAMTRNSNLAWFLSLAISLVMPVFAGLLLHEVYKAGVISYALGGWAPPYGIEYRVDVANAFVLLIVSVMGAFALIYAKRVVEEDIADHNRPWFYTMYLLCLCGLLGIAVTGDAFNAFVFLEVSSLSTYAMIAMGRDRRALIAAYQYLIMGTIGATLYVLGVGILFAMTGTLNFADMAEQLKDVEETRPIFAALSFIIVGLSLKVALFPLHKWLPNAYAYAPTMATVFLASTATKVAIYLLVRFVYSIYAPVIDFGATSTAVVIVGLSLLAMFIASFVACTQKNVERMLAFSSVAQIGYITLGMSFGSKLGLTGGLVHLLNHAVMKGALFMCTGAIMLRLGSVKLDDMAGIGRKMPITMAMFVLAGLSLIGVPGTVGFVSKWYLALASFEAGHAWLAFAIMASSLLAVVYIGRVVEVAYFREPSFKVMMSEEPPLSMMIPTALLVVACIYFGIDAELTAETAAKAAEVLLAGIGGSAQ